MKEVDGFTLIDYIKSSIEILMNMKIEENENNQSTNLGEKQKLKKKPGDKKDEINHIPKIDDKTPTSSILDLQRKLDQISSPISSSSSSSIPAAHKEYEKILRQLETECRNHIKVEQQMKLHIECLQEKIDGLTKERDAFKKQIDSKDGVHLLEIEKLNKITKTLEEELANKVEKIKQ